MSFVYPYFLFAISAISIPIIVHLFNFRKYKRVYFSDVTFLKEVKLQTQAINKLKHLLILISRILTVLFLVLAFAQPYIPINETKLEAGAKLISIFVDNSFSMEALNENGSLLNQAKKNAKEIAMAYAPTDKFQLLTQDFEAKHQRLVNRETFIEWLNDVKISPVNNGIKEIVNRQRDALKNKNSTQKNAFIVSDFQKESYNLTTIANDTTITYHLNLISANKPSNVYIDSCWYTTPARQENAQEELIVKICNQSEKTLENIPIKLLINNQQRAINSVTLNANECKEVKLNYASKGTGIQNGKLEMADYPITYDDKFYFSYSVISKIDVLDIESDKFSMAVQQILKQDSLFNYKTMNEKNIDYSSFKKYNLIILNNLNTLSSGLIQELTKFTNNGGSLLIFPGVNADITSYNTFFKNTIKTTLKPIDTTDSKVNTLNYKHPLYTNVFDKNPEKIDLPKVLNHYPILLNSKSNSEKLMNFANGNPFLTLNKFNKGKIYFCSSSLNIEFSNFEKHALLVPTLYKTALNSVSEQLLYATINNNNTIEIKATEANSDNVFHISNAENNFDIIPETKINNEMINLFLHNQIKNAGQYIVKNNKAETITNTAFNYNRSESKFEFLNEAAIEQSIEKNNLSNFKILQTTEKSLTSSIKELNNGIRLWKYCLLLALVFILTEIALIRFWKT